MSKWTGSSAISNVCEDYLTGPTFSIFTDNNPLTYVLTTQRKYTGKSMVTDGLLQFRYNVQARQMKLRY